MDTEKWNDKGYAVHNPRGVDINELPFIFGFDNGGPIGFKCAILISQGGEVLGSHVCSHEGFMPGDLGILAGHRADRHEIFRAHYPDGYRMDFRNFDDPDVFAACEAHTTKYNEKDQS